MKTKAASIKRIRRTDSIQLIADLRAGRYSLLASLGCNEMRAEMEKVGKDCRRVLSVAEFLARLKPGDYRQNLRSSLGRILNWGAPTEVHGFFPHPRSGVVLGFNHPTLGEIIRLIAICVTEYPNRKYLFPVSIGWYEVLAPVAYRMEKFGLFITPTITPAVREKMSAHLDSKRKAIVERIARDFNRIYLEACVDFSNSNDLIVIAPSATRQSTVFKNRNQYICREHIEPQTMTYIAMHLDRAKQLSSYFVPVAVIPPPDGNNKLNLFKEYRIIPCNWIQPDAVRRYCKCKDRTLGDRRFEHYFLKQIADELSENNADYLIYP